MVTTKVPKTTTFELDVTRLHDGDVLVEIRRPDGGSRNYRVPGKKLTVFSAVDVTVRDAVEFLLGDAR
jgi:hypothetical protein